MPRWNDRAACRGIGHRDFFPEITDPPAVRAAKNARALSYCNRCPVRAECAEAGRHEHGTWGGNPE